MAGVDCFMLLLFIMLILSIFVCSWRFAIVQNNRRRNESSGLLKITGSPAIVSQQTDFSFWLQVLKPSPSL
jgi:hypothetical protein